MGDIDLSLEDIIKREKAAKRTEAAAKRGERTDQKQEGRGRGKEPRRRRGDDSDEDMGVTRSARNPRGQKTDQRRSRAEEETPYTRGRYNTSGDVNKSWKHDLYNKDEDQVEQTGWGTRRTTNDELIKGTAILISSLHWEVSEEELKVNASY
jgi:hypothetical protein